MKKQLILLSLAACSVAFAKGCDEQQNVLVLQEKKCFDEQCALLVQTMINCYNTYQRENEPFFENSVRLLHSMCYSHAIICAYTSGHTYEVQMAAIRTFKKYAEQRVNHAVAKEQQQRIQETLACYSNELYGGRDS